MLRYEKQGAGNKIIVRNFLLNLHNLTENHCWDSYPCIISTGFHRLGFHDNGIFPPHNGKKEPLPQPPALLQPVQSCWFPLGHWGEDRMWPVQEQQNGPLRSPTHLHSRWVIPALRCQINKICRKHRCWLFWIIWITLLNALHRVQNCHGCSTQEW